MKQFRLTITGARGGKTVQTIEALSLQAAKTAAALMHPKAKKILVALIDRKALLSRNPLATVYSNPGGRWQPFTGTLRQVWHCPGCGERLTTPTNWAASPECPNCCGYFQRTGLEMKEGGT